MPVAVDPGIVVTAFGFIISAVVTVVGTVIVAKIGTVNKKVDTGNGKALGEYIVDIRAEQRRVQDQLTAATQRVSSVHQLLMTHADNEEIQLAKLVEHGDRHQARDNLLFSQLYKAQGIPYPEP